MVEISCRTRTAATHVQYGLAWRMARLRSFTKGSHSNIRLNFGVPTLNTGALTCTSDFLRGREGAGKAPPRPLPLLRHADSNSQLTPLSHGFEGVNCEVEGPYAGRKGAAGG